MKEAFEAAHVFLLGRTLSEYARFFQLEDRDLKSGRILDIAAGVSSFCVETVSRGGDVIAADPIYDLPAEIIAGKGQADLEDAVRQLPAIAHNYNWAFHGDIEGLRKCREEAYRGFLADYALDRSRYVTASLPHTSFRDNEFGLSLVSHFLFLYDDRLDYEFHKRSIVELARITQREIRIYPLVNLKGQKSQFVDQLMHDEDCSGLTFTVATVNFEFLKNANELLTIRKRADGRLLR